MIVEYEQIRLDLVAMEKPIEELGIALDIDGDFRLLVRYDDGREEALSSGEIGIRL